MIPTSVWPKASTCLNSTWRSISRNNGKLVKSRQIKVESIHRYKSSSISDEWKNRVMSEKIVKSPFPSVPVPEISLTEYMFTAMEKHGNHTMLINGITGSKYSYHEVIRGATKVASSLIKRGLRPGDKVAIYSYNDPEYVIAFLGLLAAGGISVDINPNYIERELKAQMTFTDCKFVFCHPECAAIAKKVASAIPDIKEVFVFGQSEGCVPFSEFLSDDGSAFKGLPEIGDPRKAIAQMPCSSGTTGAPKSVCKSHYSMTAMALSACADEFQVNYPGDVGLLVLPLYHIFPLMMIMLDVIPGTTQVLLPKFTPKDYLNAIQTYKVTSAPIVPPLVLFLLQHELVPKYDLSSLKGLVCGAAPIAAELLNDLKEKFNLHICRQGYGMTEICPVSLGLNSSDDRTNVGYPAINTEVKFIDVDTGEMLGPNHPGELLSRSPTRFTEYLKNPEATAFTLDQDGWVHTGDIGYYNDDGMLFVVDRLKDLIKYKGHQVAPAELEALLLAHPAVKDVAVIGIPDERSGELPRAYVILEDCEKTKVTDKQLCQFIAEQTSVEKHLHGGVRFVESIPKSAAGKVLKKDLKLHL